MLICSSRIPVNIHTCYIFSCIEAISVSVLLTIPGNTKILLCCDCLLLCVEPRKHYTDAMTYTDFLRLYFLSHNIIVQPCKIQGSFKIYTYSHEALLFRWTDYSHISLRFITHLGISSILFLGTTVAWDFSHGWVLKYPLVGVHTIKMQLTMSWMQ